MLKLVILLICIGLVWSMGEKNIVDGSWRLLDIKNCENSEDYPIKFDVKRRKCDRTTDCFDIFMYIGEIIDDSFSILCKPCKQVDGGCKPYQEIGDVSLIQFCKKYADSNVNTAFGMMEPSVENFPILANNYTLLNFKIDYCELPQSGPEGAFLVDCYISNMEEERACVHLDMIFREELDDCERKR